MSHPILELQAMLVPTLAADPELGVLLGPDGIFDLPPRHRHPPHVAIARHDIVPREGDDAPGQEHRLVLHAFAREPSRRAVLAIAARLVEVALSAPLAGGGLRITHRRHERTETSIDPGTGFARAAIVLRLASEPAD